MENQNFTVHAYVCAYALDAGSGVISRGPVSVFLLFYDKGNLSGTLAGSANRAIQYACKQALEPRMYSWLIAIHG